MVVFNRKFKVFFFYSFLSVIYNIETVGKNCNTKNEFIIVIVSTEECNVFVIREFPNFLKEFVLYILKYWENSTSYVSIEFLTK